MRAAAAVKRARGAHHVRDLALAPEGRRRIEWAEGEMPVLRQVRERFAREKPLRGLTIGACLHVTTETANLVRTLAAGGARVAVCASNPLSTQDDTAAAMVRYDRIPTFAIRGEDRRTYYAHLRTVLGYEPKLTLDDGADLVSLLHTAQAQRASRIIASMEETTTGVMRLRAMERDGALRIPVVAVNDAVTKNLFDNRYGTGQSTLDGIVRATNILLAGRVMVVAGYGWCGKGVAMRARGMGANVVVTEVNPLRALEAVMDGFRVMPIAAAAPVGDVFVTLTGDIHVIRREHFLRMKDGAILCNSGHFDVEIDLAALRRLARREERNVRQNVDAYLLPSGRRLFVLAQGRLVNLAAAEGHPAAVMDMSFATQALTAAWAAGQRRRLEVKVHDVPARVEEQVSVLKLRGMGISIDRLTSAQRKYLSSWTAGT